MNVLFVTNVVKKYALVYKNVIDLLVNRGHQVIWAANFVGLDRNCDIPCVLENIPIQSNPFKASNKKSLTILKSLIEKYKIDCIYCSTPIGSTLARIAARKKNIKVFYAAHGFLFFKHSKKRLLNPLFKLHEKILARSTDCIITITKEDYNYAKTHLKLRNNGNVYLVNGAGIDLSDVPIVNVDEKRRSLGLNANDFVLISAGFLNKNKNNIVVLKALNLLNDKRIVYLVCGEGQELSRLSKYVKKHDLDDNVRFLGYRNDINELYAISDVFLMPSFREGVPRSLLEAMNIGLPCVGSNVRGVSDLIGDDGKGGYLCNPSKPNEFAAAINNIKEQGLNASVNISKAKSYSCEIVSSQLDAIFAKEL